MLKSVLLVTASMVIGGGSVQLLNSVNAATGPSAYVVYEANITDEAAYTKALPDVEKIIKETGGIRIAGGFNKAKLTTGKPPVGNRYVIVRWDSLDAQEKAWDGGIKAWVEKYAPNARQVVVEGVEAAK
jgi:uncharacterized protein (DUF1330 family)